MKTNDTRALARFAHSLFRAALLPALLLLLTIQPGQAGSATWKTSPTTSDWNTASNWTPATVPNGSSDTATFATSNQSAVSLADGPFFTEVNGITFNAGASAYTYTLGPSYFLLISGTGITNNSGLTQNFDSTQDYYTSIQFSNSATAGTSTNFTTSSNGGGVFFNDTSTAGSGVFTANGPRSDTFPRHLHRGQRHLYNQRH